MPSPFPGMDPYLENPTHWRDVHQSFLVEARVAINRVLPAGYVARTEQRVYIVEPDRSIYPDITVSRRLPTQPSAASTGNTAVIDPSVVYSAPPEEITESFIEIIALEPQQHVVTVLELLSPGNKVPGVGHEEYVRKRGQLLRSDIHLLEIDLLRSGLHTVGVPQAQGPGREYLVSLHRGDGTWRFEIWAFGVRDRLPRVAVPLADTLPDVPLDLQVVLNDVYDGGRYGDTLDYAREPVPPLETNDATWADALLRQAGRRP
jgi:hypothetical protein